MPQDSHASPSWFVKAINEGIKGLEMVAAYLDDVIVLDPNAVVHIKTMPTLLRRLRKNNLKLSHTKGHLGATDDEVLGHSISPEFFLRPNVEQVSAFTKTPMSRGLKYICSLLVGTFGALPGTTVSTSCAIR